MKTKEAILKAYQDLCTRAGDLHFAREALISQLKQIDAALAQAMSERNALHEAQTAVLSGDKPQGEGGDALATPSA